jgi:carboxymethylenebutenolidase
MRPNGRTLMKTLLLSVTLAMAAAPAVAQDFALAQLESSPRHHEWLEVAAGERRVHCFVAYPEKASNAMAVVVIHENRGLTDWVRSLADQLAERGFIAIAPDLLSDFDADHRRTSDFPSADSARAAIYRLDPGQVLDDLRAVRARASALDGASGRTAVAGFCWGGTQSFRLATASPELSAALVFYGSPPQDTVAFARIAAPVYGFYGEDDQRINATIEPTRSRLKALGKTYDTVIYPGAGHAFMRRGDDPAEAGSANHQARDAAWPRLVEVLERAAASRR